MNNQSIAALDFKHIKSLSDATAASRLAREGYNILSSEKQRGLLRVIMEVITEPMFFLLMASSAIYFWLGDTHEALVLLSSVVLVIFITIYQENKTEKALQSLKDLSSPRALVIRGGKAKRIAGQEVVRGDVVVLSEGDRVPADALIEWSNNLVVNESILTGESMPVEKVADNAISTIQTPGTEKSASVYASTLVVSGSGVARVVKTANQTEVGKIGTSLAKVEPEKTRLQLEINKLIRFFAIYGFILCFSVAIIYGLKRADWLGGTLAGISLAMSVLPEEFPVILTVFMALGAWRLSKINVLTSRQKVIQALGGITVLCVDKTGTLTKNRMDLEAVDDGNQCVDVAVAGLSGSYLRLVELAMLASQQKPFDPLEKSIIKLYQKHKAKDHDSDGGDWKLVHEYPLSHEQLSITHVWQQPEQEDYLVAAKGAPEAIIGLCHLDEKQSELWMKRVHELASKGLRVLAVASASHEDGQLPHSQHDFEFKISGLLGFADPIRAEVPAAIASCHQAGVRVVMITGDYPETAVKIAQKIGLGKNPQVVTGQELSAMTPSELKERVGQTVVFARIAPEQKLRIVNAFKDNGDIVGMTGDGVNDAPALKSANVGIAMGLRGTDVAREAAGLVLLDDDFASIVKGINAGRRIYDNIRKAVVYVLAIHFPIAGITFLAVLADWPLMLLPVHLAFLELIIDPACSIAFENEPAEENAMLRPPRHPDKKTLTKRLIRIAVFQGISMLLFLVLVFKLAGYTGKTVDQTRAMVFTALIFANISLILANRSWSRSIISSFRVKNQAAWLVLGGSLIVLAITIFVPQVSKLFHFGLPGWFDLLLAAVLGGSSVLWFEFLEKKPAQKSGIGI
ncbi:cation-translocating P-type ATPase [Candidatus Falkowbacteria bacterium]|nr:cation-translocating P-type ATPase [Candidatus Falkowbacteria bacterium]